MNMRPKCTAIAAIFLGLGILVACFMPSSAIVVVICIAIIIIGISCLKN